MKLGIKQIVSIGLAAVLMLPASLLAQVRFSVPMDAGLGKQLVENARAAQTEKSVPTRIILRRGAGFFDIGITSSCCLRRTGAV